MILNGLQPIRTQQNGQLIIKATIVIVVVALLLSACSADWWVGDGRGDWTLDLYSGYAISKINSKEILLIYKENPNNSGGSIILPNYFIMAYQLHEPYIFIAGIHTQGLSASEDELNNGMLSYYLIDASDGKVIGPLETHNDFADCCNSLGLDLKDEWIKTRDGLREP